MTHQTAGQFQSQAWVADADLVPGGRRSVPQNPQALRVALAHVAPAVDPAAGGEERFAAAEDGTARRQQHVDQAADHSELGTGTTSLYRYVSKKEDLLDLMADAVLGEDDPPPCTGDWRSDLAALAHRMRDRLLRHPWLATLSALRPSLGPNGLRWLEFTLATVDGHGLTPDEMIIATGTVTTFVLGSVVTELAEHHTASSLSQWRAAQGAYGDSIISSGRYPVLVRIMIEASLPHLDNPAEKGFAEGLSRILDGLASRLERP